MTGIAILASGRGSNFDALASAVRSGRMSARIVAVISDRADAAVLEKARAAGIEAIYIAPLPSSEGTLDERRRAHDALVAQTAIDHGAEWLVMAGYMRVVSPVLLDAFRSPRGYARVVNVHPSLLPAFPGANSYRQAFDHGCKQAGVTIHLVDEGVDSGPILAQEAFDISKCSNAEAVERLGLPIEHRLYAETLDWALAETFSIDTQGGRIRVCSH